MRKRIEFSTRRYLAAIMVMIAAAGAVFSQFSANAPTDSPLPPPTGHVNDYAGVIDERTKQQLEDKLRAFKTSTGVEIAVAVVKTTGDRPIFEYSLAVARGWGVGAKSDDNPGALLFVAIDDRKYFTHVSRDLEDELPDGVAGNLQRQFLVPEFRKGNYAKGISDTVDAYLYTIQNRLSGGPSQTPAASQTEEAGFPSFSLFCCLAIILVIVLIIWSNRGGGGKTRRDEERWGGGFGGGGGALPWIILGGSGSSSSGSSDWGSSGGSDWGGFGGGGDFGGGGAGGDW